MIRMHILGLLATCSGWTLVGIVLATWYWHAYGLHPDLLKLLGINSQ